MSLAEVPSGPHWDDDDILRGMSKEKPRVESGALNAVDCAEYIASFEPPDYLIDGIVISGMLYALTAMTGHLKTALATLFGLSVADGQTIGGRETQQARVLLLSGENDEDQKARTIATIQETGIRPKPGQFRVISGSQAIGGMLGSIRDVFEEHGPFGLVIVDTSIAYFGGEEENANKDQQIHAGFFREITQMPGNPAVIVLCHPVKAATRENLLPRGGGAFLAAIDGNLTLWRTGERATLHWQGKYRGASFEPVEFGMKLVTLATLKDKKGRPINSVVIKPLEEYEVIRATQAEWEDENKVLYHMLRFADDSIADIARAQGWIGATGLPQKSKVFNLLSDLLADKLVIQERKKWVLTDKGVKIAKDLK